MRITNGNKVIDIPNWVLLVGALVVDNIVVNVCRTNALKTLSKEKES